MEVIKTVASANHEEFVEIMSFQNFRKDENSKLLHCCNICRSSDFLLAEPSSFIFKDKYKRDKQPSRRWKQDDNITKCQAPQKLPCPYK